jgi:hypothetical protein
MLGEQLPHPPEHQRPVQPAACYQTGYGVRIRQPPPCFLLELGRIVCAQATVALGFLDGAGEHGGNQEYNRVEGQRPCCLSIVEFRPALSAPDKSLSPHPAVPFRLVSHFRILLPLILTA